MMKVFLDEPLIDWQKNAHLQSKAMQTTMSTTGTDGTQQSRRMDVARFAQLQMRVASRKLGVSACLLLLPLLLAVCMPCRRYPPLQRMLCVGCGRMFLPTVRLSKLLHVDHPTGP